MTKDWKDECAKGMIDAIKDFIIKDIGSFEWILGEIQTKYLPIGERTAVLKEP